MAKVGEVTNAQTSRGLVADITDEVRRGQIVAVEFLLIRTFLFADVDRAPQTGDAHEVFEGPRNRYGELALAGIAAVGVVERRSDRGAAVGVKVRRVNRSDLGALFPAEIFIETETGWRIRARIEIHAGVVGGLDLLQNQRDTGGQGPRCIGCPDIDAGWALIRAGEKCQIGIARIERVCRELEQSRLVEGQEREEAVPNRIIRIKLPLARYGDHTIRVVLEHPVYGGGIGQAGNAGAGLLHQIIDRFPARLKDDQVLGKPRRIELRKEATRL